MSTADPNAPTGPDRPSLLLPGEVGVLFGVGAATVTRWVREGRLPAVRTLGGHHRFRPADVAALLAATAPADTDRAG